jgi:hypothetical protein
MTSAIAAIPGNAPTDQMAKFLPNFAPNTGQQQFLP